MKSSILVLLSLLVLSLSSPFLFAQDSDSDDSNSTAEESSPAPAPKPMSKEAHIRHERGQVGRLDLAPFQEMMIKCRENKKGGKVCEDEMMAKCLGDMGKADGECKMMITRARMQGMGHLRGNRR